MRFFYAFCLAVLSYSAHAAEPSALGGHSDWQAYQYEEDGNKVCYMVSIPQKDEGNYNSRGKIYGFVTHRPAIKQMDEVTFDNGYTFKKDTPLRVRIGNDTFSLATDKSVAWAKDVATDKRLVEAMKRGRDMVVEGTSSRDTTTKDTYSLNGFTATYNIISRACR